MDSKDSRGGDDLSTKLRFFGGGGMNDDKSTVGTK